MAPGSPRNTKKNKIIAYLTIAVTIAFPLLGYFGNFSKYIPATRNDILRLDQQDIELKASLEHHKNVSRLELLLNDIADLKRERDRLELLKIQNERLQFEVQEAGGDVQVYIREQAKIITRLRDIDSDIDLKNKQKQLLKEKI